MIYDRRRWLKAASVLGFGLTLPSSIQAFTDQSEKQINTVLVVSGWQDVNIGDIAHTPGLLNLLQTFLPDTKIILWKKSKSEKVRLLLERNFPSVKIIYGDVVEVESSTNSELNAAFEEADLMIHGSGPFVVGKNNLEAWVKHTGKPFGIFGVTIQEVSPELKSLLDQASFIYTRETQSLTVLKENGLVGDHITFAPDATFYFNLQNEVRAAEFLSENGLKEKQFICAIPRLRITPYYKIRPNDSRYTKERIEEIENLNNSKKELDHSKMREAIIAWVRETGKKVLVCPEMTYQVDIMDELLIDPLPEDVKPNVLKRGYWLPDEAASIYAKAHTVMSFECHSPIIAAAQGTPFFYLRQPEDTIKGHMYYDLEFSDWIFEIEQTRGKKVADSLRTIWTDYDGAQKQLATSMNRVNSIYKACTDQMRDAL